MHVCIYIYIVHYYCYCTCTWSHFNMYILLHGRVCVCSYTVKRQSRADNNCVSYSKSNNPIILLINNQTTKFLSTMSVPTWKVFLQVSGSNRKVFEHVRVCSRTLRFFFIANLIPFFCLLVRWLADMTAETRVVESRAFAIRATRARQKTLFESEDVARSLGDKL